MDTMIESILSHWTAASDDQRERGARWYGADTDAIIARMQEAKPHLSRLACAAGISHLSRNNPWENNVAQAIELCVTGTTGGMAASRRAAAEAMFYAKDPLSTFSATSHKTRDFARCIAGDHNAVVVDRWAVRVAGLDSARWDGANGTRYREVQEAYLAAAAAEGVSPAVMQAVTWLVAREA